jgi:hypothetical protein
VIVLPPDTRIELHAKDGKTETMVFYKGVDQLNRQAPWLFVHGKTLEGKAIDATVNVFTTGDKTYGSITRGSISQACDALLRGGPSY